MINEIKDTPLTYEKEEKITSFVRDANGDIVIDSEMPVSAFTFMIDDTIDLKKFDKIVFRTVVDGKTLLYRDSVAFGIRGKNPTMLYTVIYQYASMTNEVVPPFVNAVKNAKGTRRITIVTTGGDIEYFTVPKGCDVNIHHEDGYGVYADVYYTELDLSDPDHLNKDVTVFYLPEK
jgi:hypothetical protein